MRGLIKLPDHSLCSEEDLAQEDVAVKLVERGHCGYLLLPLNIFLVETMLCNVRPQRNGPKKESKNVRGEYYLCSHQQGEQLLEHLQPAPPYWTLHWSFHYGQIIVMISINLSMRI